MTHPTLNSNESIPSGKKKVIVLGSGPNRIGQGIEFDYCCVHGLIAIKESGYEAIMVNCNPETVSTDFDMADKLYFEPVFWEHLRELIEHEQPEGVVVQLGGQTALKLAEKLHEHGIKIIGTSYHNMDLAEDRGLFSDKLKELDLTQGNLASILGHKSKTHMSELMNGIKPFTLKDLIIINRLLKIEIAVLIPVFLSKEDQVKVQEAVTKLDKPKVRLTSDDFV